MNAFRLLALATSAILSLCIPAAWAKPGDLDATFGTDGSRYLRIGESQDSVSDVTLQPDGRLLAVGNGLGAGLAMARYTPNGALDPTFGTGGKVLHTAFTGGGRTVLLPDGRFMVLASRRGTVTIYEPVLVRFMPDGSVDSSFSIPVLPRGASAIALQADGKILFAENRQNSIQPSMRPWRLMQDGTFDTAFNDTAAALESVPGYASGLLVQPDGSIIVTGHIDTTPFSGGFIARRVSSTGVLDPSFNTAPNPGGAAHTSALQPDGKILIGGCSRDGTRQVALVRLLSNGAPDPAFDADGYAVHPTPWDHCAKGLALRADGRIAIAASHPLVPSDGFRVIQLMPDASPDASFGTGGQSHLFTTTRSSSNDLVLQADGKLVVAGDQWGRDFALARLEANGALDPAFGDGGLAVTGFMGGRAQGARGLKRFGDKLVVLAHLNDYRTWDAPALGEVGLVRVLADGTLDPTFGTGGQAIGSLSPNPMGEVFGSQAVALALQPDGKPIVAGYSLNGQVGSAAVMRFNADGSLDTTFGSGGRRAITAALRYDYAAQAVEVMGDGRIVVAGFGPPPAGCLECRNTAFVARLLDNGTLDSSFGTAGVVQLSTNDIVGSASGRVRILIQPDGSLVVTGVHANGLATYRLTTQGQLDPSFGNGGRADPGMPVNLSSAQASAIVRHADGDLTLVGSGGAGILCWPNSIPHAVLAWMNGNGGIDSTLPPEGRLTGPLRSFVTLNSALLDEQGRVVSGGSRHERCISGFFTGMTESQRKPIVARFGPSGALDQAFGRGGLAELPGAELSSVGTVEVVRLDDGRLVALTSDLGLHRIQGGGESTPDGPVGDIDGDGIPNGLETTVSRDPFVRDNDLFADARLFAMQQFRDFLGREGDAGGIDYWTNQLTGGGLSRAQVAETFLTSPEFQGTGAPMVRLYFAYFLRIPDYGGLNYWMGRFRSGESLEGISNLFAGSPEFVATYGALDNAGFVDRVYRNVLGRAPDAAGLDYWKSQIDSGMSRGQMMVQFSESPEYRSLIANEVYVTMMYVAMLRRAPDAGGFSYWVNFMDAGNSGLALTGAFVGAPEYRSRFLP